MPNRLTHLLSRVVWGIAALIVFVAVRNQISRPRESMQDERLEQEAVVPVEIGATAGDEGDLFARYAPHPDFIEPAALKSILDDPSVMLVDIRTPGEWNRGRIEGAVHIPMQQIQQRPDMIPQDRHVVLYCRTASRTRHSLRALRNAGHPSVRHLRGGILAWRDPLVTE